MKVDASGRRPGVTQVATASCRHLLIEGHVQGVGYRLWFEDTAISLGLTGWVRNRFDGRVEAVISGDEAGLDAMVRACRRGPASARVASVQVEPAEGVFPAFRRLPTA